MPAEDEAAVPKCLNLWLIYHRGGMQSLSAAPAAWGHAPERRLVLGSCEGWEWSPWEEVSFFFLQLSPWFSGRTWQEVARIQEG